MKEDALSYTEEEAERLATWLREWKLTGLNVQGSFLDGGCGRANFGTADCPLECTCLEGEAMGVKIRRYGGRLLVHYLDRNRSTVSESTYDSLEEVMDAVGKYLRGTVQ